MTLRSSLALASCAAGLLLATGTARAIVLPDSGTCGTSGTCLSITNSGSGAGFRSSVGGGTGIIAIATSGAAISAQSTSFTGVQALSQTGVGLTANSTSSNAIVAQNNRTDMNAAVISALSADANNGLAYWGSGGIIITSNTAQKGGGGSWQVFSDERLKKDIKPLRSGLEELRAVRPVTYKYNGLGNTTDDGHEYVGVIAQELEKVFPSMVTTRKGKLRPSDEKATDIKIVDPSAFTFVLINSVKEQQDIIERQERRIEVLERGSKSSLAASVLGGGLGTGFALGLIPLALVGLRRRKQANASK